ncbi:MULTISPECIES: HPP family protein [Nocardioides]|uniref:HPP family protein n=1 Tax=Nocardioides vastitatis TaxID=2568655 RepID=A0ABW0ZNM7_9ACTN|nr:CBS domain-containing protein [Nocardioides sp.]THJ06229.1 CBS domain-containing protein [Nocardioides sp.]
MLVFEVMTQEPVAVRPHTPVKTALGLLAQHRVTAMPVVTTTGKVCGVVSEADLVRDLLPRDARAYEIPPVDQRSRPATVEEVMSRHPVTVYPETDVVEAVDLLTSTTVKSVPVVDRRGHLRGVLSRSDIVRLLARADAKIQSEVDELLRSAGLDGWLVDVQDGAVQLLGPENSKDTVAARLLAATVPGVVEVTIRSDFA